jgi:uncharacterized membrane protein
MQNQKSALGLEGNVTAFIGYPIGIVALILIFIEKENKFVRFHAFQSILLWAAIFVIGVVATIVITIFGVVSYALASLVSLLFMLVFLALFVGTIFFGYKAFKGEMFKLPFIGEMAEKWV